MVDGCWMEMVYFFWIFLHHVGGLRKLYLREMRAVVVMVMVMAGTIRILGSLDRSIGRAKLKHWEEFLRFKPLLFFFTGMHTYLLILTNCMSILIIEKDGVHWWPLRRGAFLFASLWAFTFTHLHSITIVFKIYRDIGSLLKRL